MRRLTEWINADIDHFVTVLFFIGILLIVAAIGLLSRIQPASTAFQRRDAFVQECVKSERYSLDQCIQLAKEK